MPSPFAAAMAAADAVIGSTFGENVLITPRVEKEMRGYSPDPTRPEKTILGVFTQEGGASRLGGTRQGTELQGMSTLAVAPAQLWFAAEQLDALGYALRPGDQITLVEHRGRPAYAIAKRAPTDLDDQTFNLTREASS